MKVVFESTSPDTVIFETGPFYEVQFAGFIGGDNEAIQAEIDALDTRVTVLEGSISTTPTIIFTAGQNLSSGRAVIQSTNKVYYFDASNISHVGKAIGITTTSALADEDVTVQFGGTITDGSFGFTTDSPVYIGLNGTLTTTIPSTLLLQLAGLSLSATKMIIEFNFITVRS